ncbi:ABC transporter ATP-binding protein [Sporosarcina sp. Te-1]|uniref:ABC transporter ATP-binding protein n=1 Tax=Sporosarcina sp. Te-1 TaxID=2818390 RepID=UPI001A9EF5FB|nr:ABC transporter ATP-binding protein [Sporosarcina sp. Te-1]QTD40022.1 ABC transporter ATP-binding protein [Sporosarcina sp. Te-1]
MSILQINQLTKKYGNRRVLHDITFCINDGEVIGLVGPNGAGKSTLMRSILALEDVEEGSVTVKGISNQNPEFFKYVSFLPSDNYLYMQLTGYDHLAFVAKVYELDCQDIEEVIDRVGIRSYVNQPVKSYSYGMRQHLLISLSILTKPLVILMDEPFNGLDPTSIIELKQLIRDLHAQGISILVSTHNLDILEDLTKTIWFIKEGELFKTDIGLRDKAAYLIEFTLTEGQTVGYIMSGSQLPFKGTENGLLTDPEYGVEPYLEWLLKRGAKIQLVQQSVLELEEIYKDFYGLSTTV